MTVAPTLVLDAALVAKYDGYGPRYTSYPTADRFTEAFTAVDYVTAIERRNASRAAEPLSLYVHLPFCNTICFYCACNKVVTKDHGRSAKYIRYLAREIDLVGALIDGKPAVAQLHWGGGTPTFLSRDEMSTLMRKLRSAFDFRDDAEIS